MIATAERTLIEKPNKIDEQLILYDIESLPRDFMISTYVAHDRVLLVYLDTVHQMNTDELTAMLKERFGNLIQDVRYSTGAKAYRDLRLYLLGGHQKDGLVRAGWNSKNYDLPMLYHLLSSNPKTARALSDRIIRDRVSPYELPMSNGLETDYANFSQVLNHQNEIDIAVLNEKSGDVDGNQRTPASLKTVSAYAGLDVLDDEISRIDFDKWSESYYESLSPEIKEQINPDASLTPEGLTKMAFYNVQDVMNTGFLFNQPEYISTYQTKKSLLDKYQINKGIQMASPSETSAKISSLILTERKRTKFKDAPVVNFDFPMPDGSTIDLLDYVYENKVIPPVVYDYYNNLRGRDVSTLEKELEFKRANDETMSYAYYGEGYDNPVIVPKVAWDDKKENGKPKSATNRNVTVPYFDKDLNPIESYNTFSIGGAHGATSYNATDFTFERANMVKTSVLTSVKKKAERKIANTGRDVIVYDNEKVVKKRTTDSTAWAIDVGSFYPTFLVLLRIYMTQGGRDVYDEIRSDRLKLKNSLPALVDDYTPEDYEKNREQKDSKLILNSASGASNMKRPKALLPLDNSIVSMRAMGNLFIYMIATYFVRVLNARVLSTNTDGIEITFDHLPKDEQPTDEQVKSLAATLTKKWGFDLEPERLDRFVAKDANNRLEWHKKDEDKDGDLELVINKVAGKLGKGFNPEYRKGTPNRIGLDSKIDHPMVADLAVIAYMDEHPDFLNPDNKVLKPTGKNPYPEAASSDVVAWLNDWVKQYRDGRYFGTKFNPADWALFTKGNHRRKFMADGQAMQDNNRHIFVKSGGHHITSTMDGKPTKISGWVSDQTKTINTVESMNEFDPEELDTEAYAQWAYNILLTWVNPDQTKTNETLARRTRSNQPKARELNLFEDVSLIDSKVEGLDDDVLDMILNQ